MRNWLKYTLILFLFLVSCSAQEKNSGIQIDQQVIQDKDKSYQAQASEYCQIVLGAEQKDIYLPMLKGSRVGVITNQTGIIPGLEQDTHIVDALIEEKINVIKIFAPEHGFRGTADAGEIIKDGKDSKTGLPIVSLYGKNKKPTDAQIQDLDILLFDIQDVGVRFYTYISTLHYVMEAAAENGKQVIVLDRPNPNAHYIDGPILEKQHTTFVGMHPVPIVYGMTIGEYARMINGEKWLKNGIQANLQVVKLQNYNHLTEYILPVKPSPNLPNNQSIYLYPSLCFFEGTNVSEGRGTSQQFQIYGSPFLKNMNFNFTPEPNEGAKSPKHQGQICYGEDLSNFPKLNEINLDWILKAYKNNTHPTFFTNESGAFWLDKLAGTSDLRLQIEKGWTAEQIKAGWQKGLKDFEKTRQKYLLY
ncbi:MAG: DUF1343 domain-containing protein [Flavobacteriaceae bacterium]|nr:DUF1343 domain-containing protein [Flavobacteriaceae bacterium]